MPFIVNSAQVQAVQFVGIPYGFSAVQLILAYGASEQKALTLMEIILSIADSVKGQYVVQNVQLLFGRTQVSTESDTSSAL